MKLLLDTHTFLWGLAGQGLSQRASQAFLAPENELFLSAASYWEICIKSGAGKLVLAPHWRETADREMAANSIRWLPIEKTHCQTIATLPLIHRDPFDRLLVAQALVEGMTLLTADANIQRYEIPTLW